MNKNNCVILVSSCDVFDDLWHPFFKLFFKYWPDCPFPIYLISNFVKYNDRRVHTILLGEDKHWATNMINAFEKINTPYFVYFLEDVPLIRPVDTKRLLRLFDFMKDEGASCLRLYPLPGPDRPYKGKPDIGEIDKNAPYRVSTMAAIWKTQDFKDLIVPGENAWDMEIKGTER